MSGAMGGKHGSLFVTTAVGSSGQLALLACESVPGTTSYVWQGLSTHGSRMVYAGVGAFVLDRGQSVYDGLRSCADRIGSNLPGRENPRPALLDSIASWEGEAAACRDHFASACRPATLPIVAAGCNPKPLVELDAIYGIDRVEAVLGRMPILFGPLRTRLLANPSAGIVEACDRIMALPQLSLAELARHVATIVWSEEAASLNPNICQGFMLGDRTAPTEAIRRFLKAMAGKAAPERAAMEAMALCPLAPRDWMPRDAAGVEGMALVLEAAHKLCVAFSRSGASPGWERNVETMIAPVGGEWHAAALALGEHAPGLIHVVEPWVREVTDMADTYARQVIDPALAYARAATGRRRGIDAIRKVIDPATVLFGGKGILAIADANSHWHARASAMNATIESLSGFQSGDFPRPFPDFVASNGLIAVPILTARDLVTEGSRMSHCVGSYAAGCRSGSFAMVSIRTADGTRISTAQIVGGVRVKDHRGPCNAAPGAAETLVVRELVARNASLREKVRSRIGGDVLASITRSVRAAAAPAWVRDHPYDPTDPVRILRAASLWDRYVPRYMRGSVEAIVSPAAPELAAALAHLPAAPVAPSPWRLTIGATKAFFRAMAWFVQGIRSRVSRPLFLAILMVLLVAEGAKLFYDRLQIIGIAEAENTARRDALTADIEEMLRASRATTIARKKSVTPPIGPGTEGPPPPRPTPRP